MDANHAPLFSPSGERSGVFLYAKKPAAVPQGDHDRQGYCCTASLCFLRLALGSDHREFQDDYAIPSSHDHFLRSKLSIVHSNVAVKKRNFLVADAKGRGITVELNELPPVIDGPCGFEFALCSGFQNRFA